MMQFLLVGLCAGNTGMPTCQCTTDYTPQTNTYKNSAGRLVYTNAVNNVQHVMQVDYGLNTCASHDALVPECSDPSDRPAWCMDLWCYVDGSSCVSDHTWEVEQEGGKGGLLSEWFPESQLRYSYATCGTASYFAKYHAAAKMTAAELFDVPEQYVKDIIAKFEQAAERILGGSEGSGALTCDFLDSCDCSNCENIAGSQWSALAVDLRATTITFNQQERGRFEAEGKCLGRQVQSAYRAIAQKTYNDPNRIAYMYFGLQENGAIIQWPASQWCPDAYDARFRPWYAAAASGPKDVILTLDNSGSMMTNNRWKLLKDGVALVMRTLTEFDYVGIVLFSSEVRRFKERLVPATLEIKEEILQWLHDPAQDPMGGTLFDIAVDETFSLITESRSNGATTKCQAAVLFMTDGEDTSNFDVAAFDKLQATLEPRVIFFTYTFGSGAIPDLPQSMACKNDGVYWNVADGGNIGLVMSDYYKYFANGVVNTVPRWVTYADALTQETLMAACLPSYRNGVLLGAGCMDVNMLIRLTTLEQKPDYADFIESVRRSSSSCAAFDLPTAKLDEIRIGAGTDCSGASTVPYIIGGAVAGAVVLSCILVAMWRSCRSPRRPHDARQGRMSGHDSRPPAQQSYGQQAQSYGQPAAYGSRPSYTAHADIPVAQAVYT